MKPLSNASLNRSSPTPTKVTNQTKPTGRTLQSNQQTDQRKTRRLTQNKLRNCGWQIANTELNDTPKRLLGQKRYFWGNIDF
jgi:hypothetical protein